MDNLQTPVTEQDIEDLLKLLETARRELSEAQAVQAPLEESFTAASKEYQERIWPIRRAIGRLQAEIGDLQRRLEGELIPVIDDLAKSPDRDQEDKSQHSKELSALDANAENEAEAKAKDSLIEYVFLVLDSMVNDDGAELSSRLQGLVSDPTKTLGDMLEEIEWGDVWRARLHYETLADQYRRLSIWHRALVNRLAVVNQGGEQFRSDRRYGLWKQRQKGQKAWQDFLDQSTQPFVQEHAELVAVLNELRQRWKKVRDNG